MAYPSPGLSVIHQAEAEVLAHTPPPLHALDTCAHRTDNLCLPVSYLLREEGAKGTKGKGHVFVFTLFCLTWFCTLWIFSR